MFFLFDAVFILQPGCNDAFGLAQKPLPMWVVAMLAGYLVVTSFLEDVATDIACRCSECAEGSLLWAADDGTEEAVGYGVEPSIHAYHAGVYYAGIAGIDVYALGRELVCEVCGE